MHKGILKEASKRQFPKLYNEKGKKSRFYQNRHGHEYSVLLSGITEIKKHKPIIHINSLHIYMKRMDFLQKDNKTY